MHPTHRLSRAFDRIRRRLLVRTSMTTCPLPHLSGYPVSVHNRR
jgi:hypothetical protein